MAILLITGESGSGKSFASKYLSDSRGWTEYAFADDLKSLTFELLKLFNVKIDSVNDLYNVEAKNKYRKYLQQIGTECCRKVFGDDFWAERVVNKMENDIKEGKTCIISDLRYKNEQDYIKKHFGNKCKIHTVLIVNEEGERLSLLHTNDTKAKDKTITMHSSEQDFYNLQIDSTIYNRKDEDFYAELDETIALLIDEESTNESTNELLNTSIEEPPNEPTNESTSANIEEQTNESTSANVNKSANANIDESTNANTNDDIDIDISLPPIDDSVSSSPIISRNVNISTEDINNKIQTVTNAFSNSSTSQSIINPSVHSSYILGHIGEESVAEIIGNIRPEFETTVVSSTGHVADIHATDLKNNIKYIFEIKLKQNITKNDVDKFEFDIKHIKESESKNSYQIVGIFVSLNSDKIPSIGNLLVSKDKIYLTRKYFSENILDLIFRLVETYYVSLFNAQINSSIGGGTTSGISSSQPIPQIVKYEVPPNVLQLIVQLRAEYISLTREMELYTSIKSSSEQNLLSVQELISKLVVKQQFIKFINEEFGDILPIVKDDLITSDEDELRNYILSNKRKDIKKKDLLAKFPTLQTKIASMKIEDLINEYKPKSEKVKNKNDTEQTNKAQPAKKSQQTKIQQSDEETVTKSANDSEPIKTQTVQTTKTVKRVIRK